MRCANYGKNAYLCKTFRYADVDQLFFYKDWL
jgi:hypothetical protein